MWFPSAVKSRPLATVSIVTNKCEIFEQRWKIYDFLFKAENKKKLAIKLAKITKYQHILITTPFLL